ncbi:mammalian cell entry protein [Gordonia sp. TBRC 11910]|uniref:Mammalian cell entry protein n=1 Tax=Gordonia asplenii TaxID=2725283 RepID=A0A848KZU6_9ACTN|nr:MlaD family protein [Gordonia asplenii]NMO03742.1 mammalian cell entry protein [Gordonia asplenii]
MARHTTQDFIRGDLRNQLRTLALVGVISLVVIAVALVATWVIYPKAKAPSGISLQLVVPALGPGIKKGSKVLLRGAEVGQVTDVQAPTAGSVNLDLVLTDDEVRGLLTDSFDVDFRPENYFGITAVNLIANKGGSPLTDGEVIRRGASPDFTMSTMLENGSLVVDGTLTKDMIASLNQVIRYANGLAPLIRSSIIVADTMAKTQRQLPTTLLRMMNDDLDVFPGFSSNAIGALYAFSRNGYNPGPDGARKADDPLLAETNRALELASSKLFGAAGALLKSHDSDLSVLTTMLKYLLDPLPRAIGGGQLATKTLVVVDGLESSFTGTPEQKTLQLRILLGQLPAVSSSLAQMGVATPSPKPAKSSARKPVRGDK